MRRSALIALSLVALVVAACQPEPPPASSLPKVQSIVVSPGTVVAGSTFTVVVTATDDVQVGQIDLTLHTPYAFNGWSGAYPYADCTGAPFVAAPSVTREFTCRLPAIVANGQWRAEVFAGNAPVSGYGTRGKTTFEVVGGSEDRVAPVLVSESVSPSPAVVGQPFTVTVRISDEHPSTAPREFFVANSSYGIPNPPPRVEWSCGESTPTPVTATLQEFVFDCLIGDGAAVGTYGGYLHIEDAIGHGDGIFTQFQVVAAP